MITQTLELIRLSSYGTEEEQQLAKLQLEGLAEELQSIGYKPHQYGPFDYKGYAEVVLLKEESMKAISENTKLHSDLHLLKRSYTSSNLLIEQLARENQELRNKVARVLDILSV